MIIFFFLLNFLTGISRLWQWPGSERWWLRSEEDLSHAGHPRRGQGALHVPDRAAHFHGRDTSGIKTHHSFYILSLRVPKELLRAIVQGIYHELLPQTAPPVEFSLYFQTFLYILALCACNVWLCQWLSEASLVKPAVVLCSVLVLLLMQSSRFYSYQS